MSREHRVRQGECLSSIAFENGLFWETLWNDPANAELKRLRRDPNVLMPGDVVHVPDLRLKHADAATEQRHRFQMKTVPAMLKLRLAVNDEPLADRPFRACIDGEWREGVTDGDGMVDLPIPPNARSGKIIVEHDGGETAFALELGSLDPIDTEEGIRQRLGNMGYSAEDGLSRAVGTFQRREGLPETGEVDDATRARIKERFGQ